MGVCFAVVGVVDLVGGDYGCQQTGKVGTSWCCPSTGQLVDRVPERSTT